MSKTNLYTDHERFNNAAVHRHKDISNISGKDWLEDIWKAHGDDRPISHSWTEVMGNERENRSHTLYPPNCMILFLASDNQQMDLNDYPEVRNRLLVVGIDDSQELTEKVNERQAQMEAGLWDYRVSEGRRDEIREYVASIPMHMYGKDGNGGYYNPIAPGINNQNPLPQHFTEARRDFPRLMDFIKSVTLFHYDDRMEVPNGLLEGHIRDPADVTLLVTPADAWLGMRIFGEKMVLSALNLQDKDFELLKILRERDGKSLTADELQMQMRSSGYNITATDVRSSMDNMLSKGYIRKDQKANPIEFAATPFATKAKRTVSMDWPSIIEDTRETVYEVLPEPVAQEYEDRFLTGSGLLVTHPIDGHIINLEEEEANELEETVDEEMDRQEGAIFDDDMDGGGDQGTLV